MDDDERMARPDGLSIRRRRHDLRLSPRGLVSAIGEANLVATGLRETITPNLLTGIEEKNEPIPYATLRMIARGLDCDPIDIGELIG